MVSRRLDTKARLIGPVSTEASLLQVSLAEKETASVTALFPNVVVAVACRTTTGR